MRRAGIFAFSLAALSSLGSTGCGLIGEKEPGVITASLQSSSSGGCLDSLEKNTLSAWNGALTEDDIHKTAACTRSAIQQMIRQIEGADQSQSLNAAEFRAFLNDLIFRERPLDQAQADRLLRLKAYFLGGSDQAWNDSDSRNLLPLVDLVENELVYWVPLIREFRDAPDSQTWERMKARSRETADHFQKSLLATSGETPLVAADLAGMLEDILSRMEDQTEFRRPAWMMAPAETVKLLLRGKFLLTGGASERLEPESRARLAALAIRIAPYALGQSLTNDSPFSRFISLASRWVLRSSSTQELEEFLLEDALTELPVWISLDGDAISTATLVQWAREIPTALAPEHLDETLAQVEKWTAWIKPVTIGGAADAFSRQDLRRAATLAARLLPAMRASEASSPDSPGRIDPRPVLEAFLQGWTDIAANEAGSMDQTVPETRIVALLEKVSREEWSEQPAPGTLAGAVRLARYSLEGPANGTLNDAMPWERWLEMLRVASVIQGPVFDSGRKPEDNLDLLQEILGKVIEGSHCLNQADRACIPLSEIHSFFLAGKSFGNRPLTLQEAGAIKQLLIGGSDQFISRSDLRTIQGTLARLRPILLEGLRGDFDQIWVARNFRKLWAETQLRNPNGVPASTLRTLLNAGLSRLDLRTSFPGESIPDLLLLTLTGSSIPEAGTFPASNWTVLGDTLAGWLETWTLAPERNLKACRDLSAKERLGTAPECWASLRKRISEMPAVFQGKRLPWPVIDQWTRLAEANGWTPSGVSASELSNLIRAAAAGFARSSLDLRGKGLSQKALSRMLETASQLLPVIDSSMALAESPNLDDPNFWASLEAEMDRWNDALHRLEPVFPQGMGIPLWAYAEILDALPANWLTLNRKLILASSGPFFQRLWVCNSGEALCPSGLTEVFEAFRKNVRAEQLAARFAVRLPEKAGYAREDWLREAGVFENSLSDNLDKIAWADWIDAAREYPDLFLQTGGQALFVPSDLIHASNVRTFFHLQTASDYILSAYSDTHTPIPSNFTAWVQMADDFDDLAKALKVIESRTPELAATRFREANLFSPHGNGDDWLDRRELTGYLALIMSAKTFTRRMMAEFTPLCAMPDGSTDKLGQPMLDMECFRTHLSRDRRAEILDQMPGLLGDWQRWNEGDERRFLEALELTGREHGHGNAPIDMNDIDGISSLIQYLEILCLRFDRDRDGALNELEVHEMFPVVRATIAAAVRDQAGEAMANNVDLLESLFTWVLTRKSLPRGILPVKFLQWHQARQTRKFKVRRMDAMIAISVLVGPPVDP